MEERLKRPWAVRWLGARSSDPCRLTAEPMIYQKLNGVAFPMRAVRVGITVMIALIAASMWFNWKVGQSQSAAIQKEVAVVTASQKIHDYGLLLETTVKAAVANGDAEAAAQYLNAAARIAPDADRPSRGASSRWAGRNRGRSRPGRHFAGAAGI